MNLHESYRPEKSSWPIFLLEVFTPHSVHWPDEARSQKIIEFQGIITEFEYKLKTNESNFSDCDESVKSDIENEGSQFCESENSNQQYDNVHNEVSSSYDEYQEEEMCDNSDNPSFRNEYECVTMPVVEVLSQEEELYGDQILDFSECVTSLSAVTNLSSHPDHDLSQGEEIGSEILLSVDEISDLLDHDFQRYANQPKDVCVLTCYANSCDEVSSPKFDVEEDVVSEYAMSGLGGVCDSNLYVNTHSDFYVENEDTEIGSVAGSMFSCFHEDEINFDSSYNENSNSNRMVYPSELFERDFDTDQCILGMQYHDHSCDLGSNHLLEYEENTTCIQFDVCCTEVASEGKSECPHFSYLEAQGELQSNSYNSFNEVEYQAFVFPVQGIHDSVSSDQFHFQSDISYDHTDLYFHSEEGEENNSCFYMHYEN